MSGESRSVARATADPPESADLRLNLATECAAEVMERYRTNDVFAICERAGIKLDYCDWLPVTIGECEPDPPVIRVNQAALKALEQARLQIAPGKFEQSIVAHELGHLLLARRSRGAKACYLGSANTFANCALAENFAHTFASELLRLSFDEKEQICAVVRFLRENVFNHTSSSRTRTAEENLFRYA